MRNQALWAPKLYLLRFSRSSYSFFGELHAERRLIVPAIEKAPHRIENWPATTHPQKPQNQLVRLSQLLNLQQRH